jgi:hypothetical protein
MCAFNLTPSVWDESRHPSANNLYITPNISEGQETGAPAPKNARKKS